MSNKIVQILCVLLISVNILATERIGRLGLGFTNQLQNNIPSLSLKLQRTRTFSYSTFLGIDTSDTGGWNAGIKLHRNIFDEPQLTFYGFGLGALLSQKISASESKSGFEIDLGFGTEFSFAGTESLAFSIDFGFSLSKIEEFTISTMGSNFVTGSLHFYL